MRKTVFVVLLCLLLTGILLAEVKSRYIFPIDVKKRFVLPSVLDAGAQEQGDILDDLNTLGAPTIDGQFIVATGVGAFQYELTTTARTSLGIGEGDSPTLTDLILSDFAGGGETIDEILDDIIPEGILDVFTVTDVTGVTITWSAGEVWDSGNLTIVDVTEEVTPQSCTDNAVNYLKWVSGTTLTLGTALPSGAEVIIASINCANGDIWEINQIPIISDIIGELAIAFQEIFPSLVSSGLIVSEHSGNDAFDVDMTEGVYFNRIYGRETVTAQDSNSDGLTTWYKSAATEWTAATGQWEIDDANWNDGTSLSSVGTPYWYRSLFFVTSQGINWVYPTAQYTTKAQAIAAPDPELPAGLTDHPKSTILILQWNAVALPTAAGDQWIDVRPIIGSTVSGDFSDHGNLAGLADDDHTQYLRNAEIDTSSELEAIVTDETGGTGYMIFVNDASPAKNDTILYNGTDFVCVAEGTTFTFSIATFVDDQTNTQEIGTGVWKTAGNITFSSASYNNGPPDATPYVVQTGSDTAWGSNLNMTTGPAFEGPTSSAEDTNYPAATGAITFTLNAAVGAETDTQTEQVYFYAYIYAGADTDAADTEAMIEAMDTKGTGSGISDGKVLSNTETRTFAVDASNDKYIWYCYPSRLGTSTFTVGGFEGGFEAAETVSISNTVGDGWTENYYAYRSTKIGLGVTTVVVSD